MKVDTRIRLAKTNLNPHDVHIGDIVENTGGSNSLFITKIGKVIYIHEKNGWCILEVSDIITSNKSGVMTDVHIRTPYKESFYMTDLLKKKSEMVVGAAS